MNQLVSEKIGGLIEYYKGRKHPLEYKSRYQLVVMVILSAQDSDKHINELAPRFFGQYPDMETLSMAAAADLYPLLGSVRNFAHKCAWLTTLARVVATDSNIPCTMSELTRLPGIGRKSANVIIRESGGVAEGVIVDLHVSRVAPRIGLAQGSQPEKIEKQLMAAFSPAYWGDLGMALSFLGREICRPTHPHCDRCIMSTVCDFHRGVTETLNGESEPNLF